MEHFIHLSSFEFCAREQVIAWRVLPFGWICTSREYGICPNR